jgi:pyocin large subunit-like protein
MEETDVDVSTEIKSESTVYSFRSDKHLSDHYNKHGIEMGFASKEEYEEAANKVINNPDALHKTEKEDGDDVYYLEETNEFVVVSTDGFIRTYFCPDSGKKYFDKQ